jgi:hypothetical protein
MTENEITQRLSQLDSEDAMADMMYDLVDEWETRDVGFEAVRPVLEFMERNRSWDFGTPGPFVSFVEKFYREGYEDALVASIKRCPTPHTVWMLNRVLNGEADENKRAEFLTLFVLAKNNQLVDSETIDEIDFFLSTHHQ